MSKFSWGFEDVQAPQKENAKGREKKIKKTEGITGSSLDLVHHSGTNKDRNELWALSFYQMCFKDAFFKRHKSKNKTKQSWLFGVVNITSFKWEHLNWTIRFQHMKGCWKHIGWVWMWFAYVADLIVIPLLMLLMWEWPQNREISEH